MILRWVRRLHVGQLAMVSLFICLVGLVARFFLGVFLDALSGCPVSISLWACKVPSFWLYTGASLLVLLGCGVSLVVFWWTWFGARGERRDPTR